MITKQEADLLLGSIGIVFIVLIVVWITIAYNSMPTVYVSYDTKQCVRVESGSKEYTCDDLPARYKHVWVQ